MTDPFLSYLRLAGWKSFRQAEVRFGPVNVLIGSNGSGKSNLISFFDLLRAVTEHRLRAYWMSHGMSHALLHYGPQNTPRMSLEVGLDYGNYSLQLLALQDGLIGIERESLSVDRQNFNDSAIPDPFESRYAWNAEYARFPRVYQFHDTSTHARIRGFADCNQTQYLHEDGGNLAALLFRMKHEAPWHFANVERAVRSGIPGFSHFQLLPSPPDFAQIRIEWFGAQRDYPMTPHQLSDGSLRWIALCALFLQPAAWRREPIVIDEPELGLHPALLERLATIVHAASEQTQIILATQSPFLLNFFEPEEIITIDHDGRESTIRRHDRESLADWLRDYSLGELWEKNVLGGQPIG